MNHIQEGFQNCWCRFCETYTNARARNMEARIPAGFKRDWSRILNQKTFFTEWDLVFCLAEICKEEFGDDWVHINTPIDNMFFANHPGGRRGRKYIDIDIVDPSRYANGKHLRLTKHDIFAEVKWISLGMWEQDIRRRVLGAHSDYDKLAEQVRSNRCESGYVCIVDDEPHESRLSDQIAKWQIVPRVQVLVC